MSVGEDSKASSENVYIDFTASTTQSRQVLFYIPFNWLTKKGLTKSQYESLLEETWKHHVSIGKHAIGGRDCLSVFETQLIDTFDQEEFDNLIKRFKGMLAVVRARV